MFPGLHCHFQTTLASTIYKLNWFPWIHPNTAQQNPPHSTLKTLIFNPQTPKHTQRETWGCGNSLQHLSKVFVVFFELYSRSWGGNKGTALIHQQLPPYRDHTVHLHKATSRNELGFPLTPCQALLNFRLTMSAHKIELNVKELTRREGGVAPTQQTPASPYFAVSLLRHSKIKEHQIPAWFDFITAGNDDDFLQSPKQLCEEKICLTVKLITPKVFSIYDTSLASVWKNN